MVVVWALAHHVLGGVRHLLTRLRHRLAAARGAPQCLVRESRRRRRGAARGRSHAGERRRFTGLRAWWVQRVSAVYMLLFVLFLLYSFRARIRCRLSRSGTPGSAGPARQVALPRFFAALLAHMWVGLRDVLLDYARPPALRRVLLVAVGLRPARPSASGCCGFCVPLPG